MEKFIYYNGLKFTRDETTNYYKNSTHRKSLHRYIWECHYGEIPKGYEIHHIDHNKLNNIISNLKMIKTTEHRKLHAQEMGLTNYEWLVKNLDENARPAASKWHGSEEGQQWHKEQYKKYLSKFTSNKVKKTCEFCNKEFETIDTALPRFCSNNCKSAWRRKSGADNEKRVCILCGDEFETNKYRKTKTCSRKCADAVRKEIWKQKREVK